MFISFFTGKVMLFFGISLIMKEKSNASALGGLVPSRCGMTKRIVVFLLLFISRARRFPAGKVIDILICF